MCRIASLFLLQRQKRSMSGDARDFNNIETRAVITFFSPARQSAEGNSHHSDRNVREAWTIVCHRQKHGNFSTCDAPRPGLPKTVTTSKIIDQFHELILEDRRISAKSIVEQLGFSRERVGPSFLKIWTFGSSPWSGSRSAWMRIKNGNGAIRMNKFGITSEQSKWFPVAIGDHGRNLVLSLRFVDKAAINGVVA